MTPTETMAESGTGSSHGILNVTIQGSGPYGFRLSGGDGEPMAIIKVKIYPAYTQRYWSFRALNVNHCRELKSATGLHSKSLCALFRDIDK